MVAVKWFSLEQKNTFACGNRMSSRLNIIQCARPNGSPWDRWTCHSAAKHGHPGILQWPYSNGCPFDENRYSVRLVDGRNATTYLHGLAQSCIYPNYSERISRSLDEVTVIPGINTRTTCTDYAAREGWDCCSLEEKDACAVALKSENLDFLLWTRFTRAVHRIKRFHFTGCSEGIVCWRLLREAAQEL